MPRTRFPSKTRMAFMQTRDGTWSWRVQDHFDQVIGYGTGAPSRAEARKKANIVRAMHREDCAKRNRADTESRKRLAIDRKSPSPWFGSSPMPAPSKLAQDRLKLLASGLSLREVARLAGVSHQAIHNTKKRWTNWTPK